MLAVLYMEGKKEVILCMAFLFSSPPPCIHKATLCPICAAQETFRGTIMVQR